MMTNTAQSPKAKAGQPVWELARLFPHQGEWSEEEYLALQTSRLIEFDDGYLEFPPMPTLSHQDIVLFLYELLKDFVATQSLGRVYVAPLRVRLWAKKYREPDVVFLTHRRLQATTGEYPYGADLVMEVVSGSGEDRERDLVTKRKEYARAGIAEYWIVDPQQEQITVLTLAGEQYEIHGEFGSDARATSALLDGFAVDVAQVFAAANKRAG